MRVRDVKPGETFEDRDGRVWVKSSEEPVIGQVLCVCMSAPKEQRWPKPGSVSRMDWNADAFPVGYR